MNQDPVSDAAVKIFAAYVSNHQVAPEDLKPLAAEVRGVVGVLFGQMAPLQTPAVPIDESYTDEKIICLEDGAEVTLLGRYLKSHHGMTPEEYRSKWGLPEDYPFVAKAYSEKRSQIAKDQGLGKS